MGYTHYWREVKKANDKEAFEKFANVCSELHKNLPKDIIIRGGLGDGEPVFNNEIVNFNGDGSQGLDHETFHMEFKDSGFNFCKTARKPYDLLVGACLLAAYFILDASISSDGDVEDWKPIQNFFNEVMEGEYIVTNENLPTILGKK